MPRNMTVSAAIRTNGARQPKWFASNSDSGTPAMVEIENALDTTLLARARREKGMLSAIMVCTSAPMMPPKTPASPRASMSVE